MGNASDSLDWLAPDPHGIHTAWLTDPNKSSLRGRRLRRAFDRPPAAVDTWPASWRELLALWVKRADPDKRYRRDGLLAKAGAARANVALALFDRLLADGLAEVEEQRDAKLGWQPRTLRFIDPAALRRALGLAEPDAAEQDWNRRKNVRLEPADLDTARVALDALPPAAALARLELLEALARWVEQGRGTGHATPRDFAYFARGDTKKITEAEWRWLADAVDLTAYGIAAHAPLLLVAAACRLETAAGTLDLAAAGGFVGLPPRVIDAIRAIDNPPHGWRLVENRSAFEKAAAARAPDEAVLWLPGYPPGWWRTAVTRLLALAPAPAAIACDPDPDGIAIALQAARLWDDAGQPWTPWHMDADDLRRLPARRALTPRDRDLLERLRDRSLPTALGTLAAEMLETGEKGEQEGLFW
jgi:hypothetical protein